MDKFDGKPLNSPAHRGQIQTRLAASLWFLGNYDMATPVADQPYASIQAAPGAMSQEDRLTTGNPAPNQLFLGSASASGEIANAMYHEPVSDGFAAMSRQTKVC